MYYSTSLFVSLVFLPMLIMGQFSIDCPPLPVHNTTTIFDLRPNDIKVMMAVGDSITTGFGLLGVVNETRGKSFSMGGDPGAVALPNFFKYFNPALIGYSTGTYPAEVCYGSNCPAVRYYPIQDANNAAKSGSMVFDMVSSQVNYLIRQINKSPNMDVQLDWKVLTIMIGANDLCASCTFNLTYLSADDYENNLFGTLERLRTSLPRTFVNLVPSYNISQAYDLSLKTPRCGDVTRPLFIQCDCLFAPENGAIRAIIDDRMAQFSARAVNVAKYYQRKAYDNFAVVVQPFAINTRLADLPTRFVSHLDCFHPSKPGQEAMAVALWNSMLTPAAKKKTTINMDDVPMCPTADTLIYTY